MVHHQHNNNSSLDATADFDSLFPSILQCFSIILAGFVSRKSNLISDAESKGVRTLLVYFLTPAMMCQCLLLVEWHEVNWKFLACVFVAKTFVFVAVAASTLFLSNDLCKSGLYAIFATQSNDMALGYPLVFALYNQSHPDYPRYIYLLMPVSLLILNPIGFFIMEIEKRRTIQTDAALSGVILRVLRGLATNPMVISTFVGLIGNVIFRKITLPTEIVTILNGFAVGFVPVALFALGCTLVANDGGRRDLHSPFATVLLLTLAKILLLPLLLRELISLAKVGTNASDTSGLATLGFLYGSFPTAPTVFVYATQFNVAVRQIAFGLALCTFLSAPWLYLSCRMISIHYLPPSEKESVLHFTKLHTNIVGLAASMLLNIFVIVSLERSDDTFWASRLICAFFIYCGEWTLRLWTLVLASSLAILRCIGFCRLLKWSKWLIFFGLTVPATCTGVLLILFKSEVSSPNFYARLESFSTFFGLSIDILVVAGSITLIIVQYKFAKGFSSVCAHSLVSTETDDTATSSSTANLVDTSIPDADVLDIEDTVGVPGCDDEFAKTTDEDENDELVDDEGLEAKRQMCPSTSSCSSEQRSRCKRMLTKYRQRTATISRPDAANDDDEEEVERFAEIDDGELAKHSIFVAFLCVSAVVNMFVNGCRLLSTDVGSPTFVQLRLLDSVMTYGQSILCVALFAKDRLMWTNLCRKFRRFAGSEKLILPKYEQLDRMTKLVCSQFVSRHLATCSASVCRTVRKPLKIYKTVFRGTDFADWLLEHAIVDDRPSAVRYGRRLILGRIIEHVNQSEHFHDSTLLYRFCEVPSKNSEEEVGVA